jgi:hypothetical protein
MKEGIPFSSGKQGWSKTTVKRLDLSDTYLPHSHEEIAGLVSPEVAATLDPGSSYGIRWWNRSDQKGRQISEPDGQGANATVGRRPTRCAIPRSGWPSPYRRAPAWPRSSRALPRG